MKRRSPDLHQLLQSFFCDYLDRVRGASPHTVRAYRDTIRLLLINLAETRRCEVAALKLEDLNADAITSFLHYLEASRANKTATRNCRLAAIRSFFKHLLRHDPVRAEQYSRVIALPAKRASLPVAKYLEPERVRSLLDQPDRRTQAGQRHHALLLFLYNTGTRISEALAVNVGDLSLAAPAQVRVQGKGSKERFCPLWKETAGVLKRLSTVRGGRRGDAVFVNARGNRLSRDGAAYVVRKYWSMVERDVPEMRQVRVTPHVLRHSCAVALLQAGIDITVIRDYLGHTSIATTSRYVKTNLRMKREALESFWEQSGITPARVTPWQPTPDVLAFLASL